MAITAIVMLGAPPMWHWLRLQGPGHAVDQLTADLHLARMMAIRQRTRCTLQMNTPGPNRYTNSLNGRISNLAVYHGDVHFLSRGPGGGKMSAKVTFNQQGMSTTVAPADLFVADGQHRAVYRVRVLTPGGISVHRWFDGRWQ